jgi:hypothetical protein
LLKRLYLLGAILGTVLPYFFFIRFGLEHGLDIGLFVQQLFERPITAFFVMDVIVSSLVLWVFIFAEGRRLGMKHLWVYVLSNLVVGVSLALPLFLYFRERKLEHPG